MIRALIFDFDGLILDTEFPEFQSWQKIFELHGATLPFSVWANFIGTGASTTPFDIYEYLEEQAGRKVDREWIREERRRLYAVLVTEQTLLPGVETYLTEAKKLGLRLGVASSSTRSWVVGHLSRFQLLSYFDHIVCGDEVSCTKPDPELYTTVVRRIGLLPQEAIALEDSPNGVRAAKRAELFCVAVPNILTKQLSLVEADLIVDSLAEIPLQQLLRKFT